jgi:hypothetical protein
MDGKTNNDSLENLEIDLIPTEKVVRALTLREQFEATRNKLAWLLTGTLCGAVFFYLVCSVVCPTGAEAMNDAFEKICFVLSPLVGLALGTYYRRADG